LPHISQIFKMWIWLQCSYPLAPWENWVAELGYGWRNISLHLTPIYMAYSRHKWIALNDRFLRL
jgi:hypothetical protein